MKYHLLRKSEGTRIQACLLSNNMRLPGQKTLGHSLMSIDCPFSRGDSSHKNTACGPNRTDSIGPQCPCGSTIAEYQDQILTLTMRNLPKVLCSGQDTVPGTKVGQEAPLPDPLSNREATLLHIFTTPSTIGIRGTGEWVLSTKATNPAESNMAT